jgi:hypothetical protein
MLAHRKYLQFCRQLVQYVSCQTDFQPLTGHRRTPVLAMRARLYRNQCQQAETCHWLNCAAHAGLLAAYWLSLGCSGQRVGCTDQLNFLLHACSVCAFPACRKRCHNFALFGARGTRFFQIDPDVEMNVRILHWKGVVFPVLHFYPLFAIVWQSRYIQFVNEKFWFLLCKYSRCGKSRLEKAVSGPIEIMFVPKN